MLGVFYCNMMILGYIVVEDIYTTYMLSLFLTSVDGFGKLVCPSAESTDQGAYSCEALNSLGSVFAQPDAIVTVQGAPTVCRPPQFNIGAVRPEQCLNCFCFGATDQCFSTDQYITQVCPYKASGIVQNKKGKGLGFAL